MANKQSSDQSLGTVLERKFRQAIARIAGRARTSIYTLSGVDFTSTTSPETVFTKTFRAGFFKSVGDTLAITIYGNITVPAGKSGSFQMRLSEDSGAIDPVDYFIRTGFLGPDATADFTGMACLVLVPEDKIQCHGITLSEDISPTVRSRRMPGPFTYNTKSFSISGRFIGDAGCSVKIDVVQIEFIPAVIS